MQIWSDAVDTFSAASVILADAFHRHFDSCRDEQSAPQSYRSIATAFKKIEYDINNVLRPTVKVLPTHSLIHFLTHSLIHFLTHSLIHFLTHSLIHFLTHSIVHRRYFISDVLNQQSLLSRWYQRLMNKFILGSKYYWILTRIMPRYRMTHLPVRILLTHSLIHSLTHPLTNELIHSLTHPLTYLLTYSLTHSLHV